MPALFPASAITVAFLGLFVGTGALVICMDRRWRRTEAVVAWTILAFAIYCVAAGIHLQTGWEDPLASASASQLSSASVRGRGRGGIIVLAIRYWPYVLIGLGAFFAYNVGSVLLTTRRITASRPAP